MPEVRDIGLDKYSYKIQLSSSEIINSFFETEKKFNYDKIGKGILI